MNISFSNYSFSYNLLQGIGLSMRLLLITVCFLSCGLPVFLYAQTDFIPIQLKASPLTQQGDFSEHMVSQIDTFLMKELRDIRQLRETEWHAKSKLSGKEWNDFLDARRINLQKIWGMAGKNDDSVLEIQYGANLMPLVAENSKVRVFPVKICVMTGLDMNGIIIQPKGIIKGKLLLIPDADQIPEQWAGISRDSNLPNFRQALQLAEQGIQIIIPALISRHYAFSGSDQLDIYTNQPHREWIYRQGFALGRHIIGFELQKIKACIDWMVQQNVVNVQVPVAIAGYGEGGLLALNTVAIDKRITTALISGYLNNSENVWQEPIYRNLFGNLKKAGNAELLAMASHAKILIEYAKTPQVSDPIEIEGRRGGAAPGILLTPTLKIVQNEINTANSYITSPTNKIVLINDANGVAGEPFSAASFKSLSAIFKIEYPNKVPATIAPPENWVESKQREKGMFEQLENLIQQELDVCERERNQTFWGKISHDPVKDEQAKAQLRAQMHEVIGKISQPLLAPAPKARLLESNSLWSKYEIVLDVWEGVPAWGILVVPKNAESGKPLPVIVCQHGLEGLPDNMITRDTSSRMFKVYKSMALDLAERGYVTFSPHNPYRGEHKFRVLQRKANPVGLSLFSVIAGQHQQIVNWLGSLPFVDSTRIGFYGLSYGGKSAMRLPALIEGYALSICSGDFNEWVRKVSTTRERFSYQFTKEYEIYEWNLGHTLNYAEMAALIAPRPFMVEYGYQDGIGTAAWIGYEFGKVRKHYDLSGLSDRVDIDLFNGVHEIHGVKTYPFLDRHLKP